MRDLKLAVACWFVGWTALACTSPADVASRSEAEGGNKNVGGDSGMGQGGSDAAGGVSVGVGGGAPGEVDLLRSPVEPITNPDVTDAEYATFISDSNAFGLELYQHLQTTQQLTTQNIVFSPVSAQLALAMTYGAAVGDTAADMKTALKDNLGAGKYHAACNRLQRELASRNYSMSDIRGYTHRVELTPANSLWLERTWAVKTSYLELLGQHYDSGMRRVNFIGQPDASRLAINAWVEDQTHDRIKDLLVPRNITTNTRFVLVNALYFYGTWLTLFNEQNTAAGTFHTLSGGDVAATMMNQEEHWRYESAAGLEVIQLPYVTSGLWMTVVLPTAGQFEATRSQVSEAWLTQVTRDLTSQYVALTLPRFKIETPQLYLTDGLKAMGMASAFDESANFAGMTDERPLYIEDVVQKAFIGVDEDGTEAAAATAVVARVGIEPEPIPLVIDRPFLYFIQDKTGLVLFAGQVVDPTQ